MAETFEWNRRKFIKSAAISGCGASRRGEPAWRSKQSDPRKVIRQVWFLANHSDAPGLEVSAMGLGGYHLGSAETDQAATEIVAKAIDHGVNFFDNAWEYHDGLSEERLGKALKGKRSRQS